jgi:hypothetical protein
MLNDFWASVNSYGIHKLNHSRNPNILALNISQIYQCIDGLPMKSQLFAILMQSQSPHPVFMQHNNLSIVRFLQRKYQMLVVPNKSTTLELVTKSTILCDNTCRT